MTGSCRLRDSEDRSQIADAELPILQQVQDSEPRPVGEGAEEAVHREP